MVIEMPPDARDALLAHTAELHQCGFEVAEFGATSIRVDAMPAILSGSRAPRRFACSRRTSRGWAVRLP